MREIRKLKDRKSFRNTVMVLKIFLHGTRLQMYLTKRVESKRQSPVIVKY